MVDVAEQDNGSIDLMKALTITLNVVEVSDWIKDSGSIAYKVRIFMLKLPSRTTGKKNRRVKPTLMIVGYVSSPEQFDAGLKDFEAFIDAITIRRLE